MRAHDWAEQASCKGQPVNVFFPPKGTRAEAATRFCRGCPVRVDCLMDAVRLDEWDGTRGGMPGLRRDQLRHVLRRLVAADAREALERVSWMSPAELDVMARQDRAA